MPKWTVVLARTAALAVGVLAGFFVAFNAVFSDVFGLDGMLGAIAYVLVSYAVVGFVFGLAGPKTSWRWTPWLAGPGVLLAALMLGDDAGRIAYVLGVMLSAVVAAFAGSWAGARARGRRVSPPGPPPPQGG